MATMLQIPVVCTSCRKRLPVSSLLVEANDWIEVLAHCEGCCYTNDIHTTFSELKSATELYEPNASAEMLAYDFISGPVQ